MNRNDITRTFWSFDLNPPDIVMYDQLTKLMPCIFLYQGKAVGHWCAILKHPDSWEIFDPIGLYPDTEIDHPLILHVRKKLYNFCIAQNSRVEYNDWPLQKGGRDCGLWCILRFIEKDLSYEQFKEKYKSLTDEKLCWIFDRMDLLN